MVPGGSPVAAIWSSWGLLKATLYRSITKDFKEIALWSLLQGEQSVMSLTCLEKQFLCLAARQDLNPAAVLH